MALKVLDLVKDCFYFKEYIGTVIHNLIKSLEHCEYREQIWEVVKLIKWIGQKSPGEFVYYMRLVK